MRCHLNLATLSSLTLSIYLYKLMVFFVLPNSPVFFLFNRPIINFFSIFKNSKSEDKYHCKNRSLISIHKH